MSHLPCNTLLSADLRYDVDAASLEEVRDRLQFLADTDPTFA